MGREPCRATGWHLAYHSFGARVLLRCLLSRVENWPEGERSSCQRRRFDQQRLAILDGG